MDYISVKEYAEIHGLSERTVRNYCSQGIMQGAKLIGKTWNIPKNSPLPKRKNAKKETSPLLKRLRVEMNNKTKDNNMPWKNCGKAVD